MRMILLATVVLGLTVSSVLAAASAPKWVESTTATTPLTPFALKQAKAQGIELQQEPGTPLRGLLVHPEGAGPFPAVVLLHGCDGIQPFQEQWADDLANWGYAALLADTHGPRGMGMAAFDPCSVPLVLEVLPSRDKAAEGDRWRQPGPEEAIRRRVRRADEWYYRLDGTRSAAAAAEQWLFMRPISQGCW